MRDISGGIIKYVNLSKKGTRLIARVPSYFLRVLLRVSDFFASYSFWALHDLFKSSTSAAGQLLLLAAGTADPRLDDEQTAIHTGHTYNAFLTEVRVVAPRPAFE